MGHIIEKTIKMFRCNRCNHEWHPRNIKEPPAKCPKCQSAYWNRKRRKPVKYQED